MDISVKTQNFTVEDHSWLGSRHGTDETRTITLDKALFTSGTHYPNGYIPSGMTLAKKTSTGLYGPYDDAAVDGRAVMAGHLFASIDTSGGAAHLGAALLEHGAVKESNLPANHGLDAAGKTDVAGRIIYR